jgi:membrane protein DedA with SNARE-associated domain
MHEYLLAFSLSHSILIYAVVVIIAMLEGPFLSLFLGGLLFAGYFSLIPLYVSLMLGDLIGDVVWYYLGFRYGHGFATRFGKRFNITEDHITKASDLFHQYKNPVLFLSKISNGLGFAIVVLFTAGLSKIPFWRYVFINVLGQLIWSGVLLAIGFYFGNLYVQITSVAGKIFLVAAGLVIIVLIFRYIKYLGKKLENN